MPFLTYRSGVDLSYLRIFEHPESEPDVLRLLFGKLPASRTGTAIPPAIATSALFVSPHYARLLANIAHQRGFDGYLLNFEWHLRIEGGIGQARALTAWISLLQAELKTKVGPHAEVIW
jgi:mannosyl-glycoprotein endo-beta-N-acetylglucosaminidase